MSDADLEYGEASCLIEQIRELEAENNMFVTQYEVLAARYDDAMKRIQDMQAELEFLRSELARRA